jgi:flagellar basal body-associated protein FliL
MENRDNSGKQENGRGRKIANVFFTILGVMMIMFGIGCFAYSYVQCEQVNAMLTEQVQYEEPAPTYSPEKIEPLEPPHFFVVNS